jgi:hypothetical protein
VFDFFMSKFLMPSFAGSGRKEVFMMAIAHKGQFQGSLLELVKQFITANLTGRLRLHSATEGQIYIRNGWVIHAVHGSELGQAAFEACLHLDQGSYEFEYGIEASNRTITDSFARLVHHRPNPKSTNEIITVATDVPNGNGLPINQNTLETLEQICISVLGPAGRMILEGAAADLGWALEALPRNRLGKLRSGLLEMLDDPKLADRLQEVWKRHLGN